MKENIYEIFKGRKLLFHGSLNDVMRETGFSKSTIKTYTSKTHWDKNINTDAIKIKRYQVEL